MKVRHLLLFVSLLIVFRGSAFAADPSPKDATEWKVGTPIVTYFAGPPMTEHVARQMAEGGFNVVWCAEKDLDLVHKHGLRGTLHDRLLSPASLDAPAQKQQLDALIDRVKKHPAFYSYYITDEPGASEFPALGKLTGHLRQRDPAHMAYINLFPTYATNQQLGTKGDLCTAYRQYLKLFIDAAKPMLLSYDHYQFSQAADGTQYFVNLGLIRRAAQDAGVPFLNIVQACSWQPGVRVPVPDEMRYLVYTTAAYGAQGISYYVYSHPGHVGAMALADGTPTPLYHAVKPLNREFVAIVAELQPFRSIAVYHTAITELGCEFPPANAVFRLDPPSSKLTERGLLLGNFGKDDKASHVVVVNLDYKNQVLATITAPAVIEEFDASTREWSSLKAQRAELHLPPGGGKLLRLHP